jgi:hypothetical protein
MNECWFFVGTYVSDLLKKTALDLLATFSVVIVILTGIIRLLALLSPFCCFLGVETVQHLYIAVSRTALSDMLLVGCHVIVSSQVISNNK